MAVASVRGPWAAGTAVSAYRASQLPPGVSIPSGTAVASGTADANGEVELDGDLELKVRYIAFGGGRAVQFLVPRWAQTGQVADRTRLDAIEEAIGPEGSAIAVLREAPINVQYPEYDAKGDGSTDDTAAFAAAKAALGANGGDIYVPPGTYNLGSTGLDFDASRAVRLMGSSGVSAGAATATVLRFSGASGSAISGRSSYGLHLSDLMIQYTNADYDGSLIDLSQDTVDTAYGVVERCYIGGLGVRGAACLVDLDKAITMQFRDCVFTSALNGVRGQAGAGSYSNAIAFTNCTFLRHVSQHARNAGEAWTFDGCTFEQLVTSDNTSAGAGAYTHDSGVLAETLTFRGCWFGDANSTGSWITFGGSGLNVYGCQFGNGDQAVTVAGGNAKGVAILGNRFESHTTSGVGISGTGNEDFHIAGNYIAGTTPKVMSIGGTFPKNSRIQGGDDYTHQSDAQILTATVTDASFPFTPIDGQHALELVAGTVKACWRVDGSWVKVTAS